MKNAKIVGLLALVLLFLPLLGGCETALTPQQMANIEAAHAAAVSLVDGQRAAVNTAIARAEEAKREAMEAVGTSKEAAAAAAAAKIQAVADAQIVALNTSEAVLAEAEGLLAAAKTGTLDVGDAAVGVGTAVGGPVGAAIGLGGVVVGLIQRSRGKELAGVITDLFETLKYVNDTPEEAKRTDVVKAVADNLDDPNAKSLLSDGVLYNGKPL